MAEILQVGINNSKAEKYQLLLPQITALISDENNVVANLANIMACLKTTFQFFWVGVYFVVDNQLVLGPFQGPLACTRINKGKGVCGLAWSKAETVIVPNVANFEGHIACNPDSKSEIVVPVFDNNNQVMMVIDIDENKTDAFDDIDQMYLEKIAAIISNQHA